MKVIEELTLSGDPCTCLERIWCSVVCPSGRPAAFTTIHFEGSHLATGGSLLAAWTLKIGRGRGGKCHWNMRHVSFSKWYDLIKDITCRLPLLPLSEDRNFKSQRHARDGSSEGVKEEFFPRYQSSYITRQQSLKPFHFQFEMRSPPFSSWALRGRGRSRRGDSAASGGFSPVPTSCFFIIPNIVSNTRRK